MEEYAEKLQTKWWQSDNREEADAWLESQKKYVSDTKKFGEEIADILRENEEDRLADVKRYGEERAYVKQAEREIEVNALLEEKAAALEQEKHSNLVIELERREAEAMKLTGQDKTAALKGVQELHEENVDSYVSETGEMVKADEAQVTAYENVDRIQKEIQATHALGVTQRLAAIGDITKELTGLKEEMDASKVVVDRMRAVVDTLKAELEKSVDMDDTIDVLQDVKGELEEIMKLATAEIEWNIDVTMTSSPKRPFSDGIKHLKKQLAGIPAGAEFNVAAGGVPVSSTPPMSSSVRVGGAATFNGSITIVQTDGEDGVALAERFDKEMALRWKSGTSNLKQAMEN